MNKPTVALLKLFKRLCPNSAKADVNKACYSYNVFGEADLKYEFKFWIEESGNKKRLYGECTYTYGYIANGEIKAAIAQLKEAREHICATCKFKSNKDVCNRVCLYTNLKFSETAISFTFVPTLVNDTAEAAFQARDFQQIATDTFCNFIQDADMLVAMAKSSQLRQVPVEQPAGFNGFKPGSPKN